MSPRRSRADAPDVPQRVILTTQEGVTVMGRDVKCSGCGVYYPRRDLKPRFGGVLTPVYCRKCLAPKEVRTEPCGCRVQYYKLNGAWQRSHIMQPCADPDHNPDWRFH